MARSDIARFKASPHGKDIGHMHVTLHGYWRSSASYRVRLGLNLKGVDYRQTPHDLRRGAQHDPAYRMIAPQGLVPALEVDGDTLTQSLAILEWLEERHPQPPLLPDTMAARAIVRGMMSLIACDIHPLNNLRVLQSLRVDLGASEDSVQTWIARWIGQGFASLETLVRRYGHGFCFGDTPSLADCCLIPQIYNARRFAIDLANYPALLEIDARCADLEPFARAMPDRQPDADGIGL